MKFLRRVGKQTKPFVYQHLILKDMVTKKTLVVAFYALYSSSVHSLGQGITEFLIYTTKETRSHFNLDHPYLLTPPNMFMVNKQPQIVKLSKHKEVDPHYHINGKFIVKRNVLKTEAIDNIEVMRLVNNANKQRTKESSKGTRRSNGRSSKVR